MSEVIYSINGKNFKEFEVYVSDSTGLVGLLPRKDIKQYDWAEYHGISPDLSKPKFKEREIELKCFVRGENWELLFSNFREFIVDQFSKSHTQRLHVEPLNYKTLAYEVYLKDEVKIDKTFHDGEMVATFTLKFIEANPIKKVLKTSLDTFKLAFNIDSQTEIFFGDGTKQVGRGNVNLTKEYNSPSYDNSGINLSEQSAVNDNYFEVFTIPQEFHAYYFSVEAIIPTPKNIVLYVIGRKMNNTYEVVAISPIKNGNAGSNTISVIKELNVSEYGKFILKVLDSNGNEIPGISFKNPRIEEAEVIGEWKNMLGKEKIIIIAGNIEDLKDLNTEADLLWQKI